MQHRPREKIRPRNRSTIHRSALPKEHHSPTQVTPLNENTCAKPHPQKRGIKPADLCLLALLSFFGAIALLITADKVDAQFTDPGPVNIIPAPEHVNRIIDTARPSSGPTKLRYQVFLQPADLGRFRKHFRTMAPSQGWYPHGTKPHNLMVVLPAEELPLLQAVAEDPVGWVSRNTSQDKTAKTPPALNLVNAELELIALPGSTLYRTINLSALYSLFVTVCLLIAAFCKAHKRPTE